MNKDAEQALESLFAEDESENDDDDDESMAKNQHGKLLKEWKTNEKDDDDDDGGGGDKKKKRKPVNGDGKSKVKEGKLKKQKTQEIEEEEEEESESEEEEEIESEEEEEEEESEEEEDDNYELNSEDEEAVSKDIEDDIILEKDLVSDNIENDLTEVDYSKEGGIVDLNAIDDTLVEEMYVQSGYTNAGNEKGEGEEEEEDLDNDTDEQVKLNGEMVDRERFNFDSYHVIALMDFMIPNYSKQWNLDGADDKQHPDERQMHHHQMCIHKDVTKLLIQVKKKSDQLKFLVHALKNGIALSVKHGCGVLSDESKAKCCVTGKPVSNSRRRHTAFQVTIRVDRKTKKTIQLVSFEKYAKVVKALFVLCNLKFIVQAQSWQRLLSFPDFDRQTTTIVDAQEMLRNQTPPIKNVFSQTYKLFKESYICVNQFIN